jgi:hypothetical protein
MTDLSLRWFREGPAWILRWGPGRDYMAYAADPALITSYGASLRIIPGISDEHDPLLALAMVVDRPTDPTPDDITPVIGPPRTMERAVVSGAFGKLLGVLFGYMREGEGFPEAVARLRAALDEAQHPALNEEQADRLREQLATLGFESAVEDD